MGQVYAEFQSYVKAQKEIGVMLNINSKNEYDNAIAGLGHPDILIHMPVEGICKAVEAIRSRHVVDIVDIEAGMV